MFSFGANHDSEKEAARAASQRRRAVRKAREEEDEDASESTTEVSAGIIKRDLQLGLGLAALVTCLIGMRVMPEIEPAERPAVEGNPFDPPPAVAVSPLLPPASPVDPPKRKGQSPLTDVAPKGFSPPKVDSSKQESLESSMAKSGPLLPPPAAGGDAETPRKVVKPAGQKSEVVTEFVPFVESGEKNSSERSQESNQKRNSEPDNSSDATAPKSPANNRSAPGGRTKLVGTGNNKSLADSERKKSAGEEGSTMRKGPIHPFFQRFLDEREYPVRYGDTLELIAYRLYGDERMANAIRESNRDLLAGAAQPKTGTRLKLP